MRIGKLRFILIVLLVTYIIIQDVGIGTASPEETVVSVDPPTSTALIGETFTVNITVTDVVINMETPPLSNGLYSWSFNMTFNPSILNVTNIQHGPFLGTAGYPTLQLTTRINNTEGWVFVGEMINPFPSFPPDGASGSGVLATVTFGAKGVGVTLLNFVDTKLDTFLHGKTKAPIRHVAVDGIFDNTGIENDPPVAIFTSMHAIIGGRLTGVFNASASYDPNDWLFSYYWDFGDGANATGIVQHVKGNTDLVEDYEYEQGGIYTATLTVTDYYGATNTATADIAVTYDVAITNLTISPTKVKLGDPNPITINATVKNEGNYTTPSDLWVATYYDDNLIENKSVMEAPPRSNLNPSASKTLNFTWNTADLAKGEYTIKAVVANVTSETDTIDNTKTKQIKIVEHDIAVSHINVPTQVMVEEPIMINVTIENIGLFKEAFNLTVSYDTTIIGFNDTVELSSGNNASLWFSWNTTGVAPGAYTINVTATVLPTVENPLAVDDDPTDNTKTKQIKIVAHDVAVTDVDAPIRERVGATVMINATVENQGLYEETLNLTVFCDSIYIGSENITLGMGESANVSFSWNTTDVAPGAYTINVTATVLPTVENPLAVDDDPTDNTKTTAIELEVHDIAIISITAPESATAGEIISINVTIENQGSNTEKANVTIRHDSTYIDSQTVTLASGTSTNASLTWDTSGLTPGTYTINVTATVLPTVENPLAVDDDPTDNTKLSDAVTIKSIPVASFTYLPSAPYVGETVTFNASASDDADGWIVSYTWNFGDGNITAVDSTKTTITHSYAATGTYEITLNVTDNDGLTNMDTQSVNIGKMNSTIDIDLSPKTITLGENTTISGSIDPERSEVTVTIWYRLKGEETWNTVTNLATDENSHYSYVWTPESEGTYEIKASWEGDENTFADETEKQELTVQEAPPPPDQSPATLLYIIVAIVAAVIMITIIVGYFFIRARKPT